MRFPNFSKAIVWGCNLHAHTNSYIYAAFYKAFKSMGFDAYWLNKDSNISGIDFANTIFITEGQHDGNIPIRQDCKYVLHNCDAKKYETIKTQNKLILQTFTNACFQQNPVKIAEGSYYLNESPEGRWLFQPWGTDLLPNEINLDWVNIPREKEIHWVGSVCGGDFSNLDEIEKFKDAAWGEDIEWFTHHPGHCSFEWNQTLIQKSIVAPAIHGTWQAEKGYISCRTFKNLSYGHLGVTNCKAAHDLLEGHMIYNSDTRQLYFDAKAHRENKSMVLNAMKLIRDKHTYVNRIENILRVI